MPIASSVVAPLRSRRVRSWTIRIAIALLVFEVFYVVAANIFIGTDLFSRVINKKPEKTSISWQSARTYLPGWATVEGFTLRSQTKRDQVYVHVAEARARISLVKLLFRTIHIRGVDAREVDFRYRERLDSPRRTEGEEKALETPHDFEYYPEIPGLSNPPDPKPEDLYPPKKKRHPWTIKITGADVEGPVAVALNAIRIEGDGSVGGGVTVRPRETITIHRGKLGLNRARVTFGPDVVTEDLAVKGDLRLGTFPAKVATMGDILGGVSGTLSIAGRLSDRAAVRHQIVPGLTTFGAGVVGANLRFKNGVIRSGSKISLHSDAFQVRIMELDATGSATVSTTTERKGGQHVTTSRVEFGEFQFLDPSDASVAVAGSGLQLTAEWDGLSVAGNTLARRVEVVVPTTEVRKVEAFDALLPPESALSIESGTGELQARLEVNEDLVAIGKLDLVVDDIVLESREVPIFGDLEVHAILAEGDLQTRRFNLSGTTIRVDDVVDRGLSEKQQEKLEPWFCDIAIERGLVTFGKPMTADGRVGLKMYDVRPLVALLKDLSGKMHWLSLMPNIKDVDGSTNFEFGEGLVAVEDLALAGKDLEVLGWIHIRDKKADGRIFARYGILSAGVALDQGQRKIHLAKSRKWFEEQPGPLSESVRTAASDDS